MRIKFGEWVPDAADMDGGPVVTVAENVRPTLNGYREVLGLSNYSTAMTVTTGNQGIFFATKANGTGEIYAGTATTLEQLQSAQTWSDVSKAGGYSAASWDFTQIGNRVIATDYASTPQYYDIGVSSLFANLAGSPPSAKLVSNVRNFVVMGDTTTDPSMVQWSGFNNSEQWTPSRSTQSDTRALNEEFGRIMRIVPGQYGIVFQERGIWSMDYVGPPVVFNFTQIGRGIGTYAQRSVCWYADMVFFMGSDGFYVIHGRQPPTPISNERIMRWFYDQMSSEIDKLPEVVGAIDAENNTVYWSFNTGAGTFFTHMIGYNWVLNKWSYVSLIHETIASLQFTGTKETDDDRYKLIALDTSQRLADFTGTALVAKIETSEFGEEMNSTIDVVPHVTNAGTSVTIADGTRDDEDETYTFSSATAVNAIGVVNFRTPARYHRIQTNITGGFDEASGLDVNLTTAGKR